MYPLETNYFKISFSLVSLKDVKCQIKMYKNKESQLLKKDQEKEEAELWIIWENHNLILPG